MKDLIPRLEVHLEDLRDACQALDSHALVDEALDLATAKLATARVCDKCKGTGCRFGYWHDNPCHTCLHCVNGVQFSDDRARELLERLKRAEEDSQTLDALTGRHRTARAKEGAVE